MTPDERKSFFEEHGYFVVERLIKGDLLHDLRTESEALANMDYVTGEVRVWHERALFRRKAFRQLLEVPELFELAETFVGADVQLLALDLLLIKAGTGGIRWHRDVTFTCNKTISMNTGIYLADLDDEIGPLRVIPGSHRSEEVLEKLDQPHPHEVVLNVPAGTAVFFDAGCYHSGGANKSNKDRLAVFPYFGHYWVKRMDAYFTQPFPAELKQTEDPVKRQLLGLDLRHGVKSYHGDGEHYNRNRGEPGVDYV
ncbi:MAG: phytanoyl-CoA dioxygenase family protein [Planctomycetota bacterium]|nr:phytanoyl-CoA dioxygenase family protein [Planctomycetota bacterium]